MKYEFASPEPPKFRGGIAAGRIEIETGDTAETAIDVEVIRGDPEGLKVEQRGRDIVIEQRKRFGFKSDEYQVRIRAPHGGDIDFNLASADLRADGRFGSIDVNTASGDIDLGEVERNVKVRSASGDVKVGQVGGRVDVNTASGDIQVHAAGGGGSIRSASGDVQIRSAGQRVSVQTASGDQLIESVAEGLVDLKSASGDVQVGIKQGSRLHVDARSMSGDTTSEVELLGVDTGTGGPLVQVKAATMSGAIRVVRA